MAGQVRFILDAEPAKAVAGFLKVLEAQKKVEGGFKTSKKHSDDLGISVEGVGHRAKDALKNVVEFASGFATFEGVKELISKVAEEIKHAREEVIKFHESAAGGESMPEYEKNLPAYKQRSLALSAKYGADVNQVVNPLREKVYTDASDESPEKREQMVEASLKARHMAGADPMAFAGVMDNLMDAYKMSPKQAANAAMFFKEKGGMGFGEQGETLSGVLPTMKTMGVPFQQVEALMGMVPQMGGSNSAMGRGLKEGLFKLDFGNLADKGAISKGGDLFKHIQEISQLQQKDPEKYKELLGDVGKRAAPAIDFIVKNPAMYRSLLGEAAKYGKGDRLEEIEKNKLADPETAAAMRASQIDTFAKNAPLDVSAGQLEETNRLALAQAEAARRAPVGVQGATGAVGGFRSYLTSKSPLPSWLTGVATAGILGGPDLASAGQSRLDQTIGGGGENAATKSLAAAADKLHAAATADLRNRNLKNNAEN